MQLAHSQVQRLKLKLDSFLSDQNQIHDVFTTNFHMQMPPNNGWYSIERIEGCCLTLWYFDGISFISLERGLPQKAEYPDGRITRGLNSFKDKATP